MVETDEFLSTNLDGFVMDSVTITTAYSKMKNLCSRISNEIQADIKIHNQHILPRYDATKSKMQFDINLLVHIHDYIVMRFNEIHVKIGLKMPTITAPSSRIMLAVAVVQLKLPTKTSDCLTVGTFIFQFN